MISQEYFEKIKKYFYGDVKKTWLWFNTSHPELGGMSPSEMIKLGRHKKLERFIDTRCKGYWP